MWISKKVYTEDLCTRLIIDKFTSCISVIVPNICNYVIKHYHLIISQVYHIMTQIYIKSNLLNFIICSIVKKTVQH